VTVPGTQWLAHERIHPGLPAHLRNHGRALLVVGFDRRERLGVPASAQPKLTGCPEGPDPPCLAEYRHQPVVPVEPEQHYRNGPTAFKQPQGTQWNAKVHQSRQRHTATTLSIVGAVFVLLGAMGIASTLQVWYQRVYDEPPAQTLWRQLTNRLLWLGGLMGYLTVQDFSFIQLKQAGGARVPIYVATFILAVAFYWWTPHVLLSGRVAWRRLFPAAVATAACVTGLGVVSALVFSSQIVSNHDDYGSIGVVMVLLSYLIGLGVCIHLGAVAGRMWDERRSQPIADPEEPPAVVAK